MKRSSAAFFIWVCALGTGCSSSPSTPDVGAPTDAGPTPDSGSPTDAGPAGPVLGIHNVTYLTDTTASVMPFDETAMPPAAGTWSGNTFNLVTSQPTADGGFVINGLPAGPYYLYVGGQASNVGSPLWPVWVVTSSRFVDLSEVQSGRPNVVPADGGQLMQLVLSGMSPFDPSVDSLTVSSLGGDISLTLYLAANAGATTDNEVQGYTYGSDWNFSYSGMGGLIDATAGDVTYVTQYRNIPQDAGITGSYGIVAGGTAAGFSEPPLLQGVLTATLNASPTSTFQGTFHAAAFGASASQIPGAVDQGTTIGVSNGVGQSAETFTLLNLSYPPSTSDVSASGQYYNVLPSAPLWGGVSESYTMAYAFPNPDGGPALAPSVLGTGSSVNDLASALFASTVSPTLTAPTQVLANGHALSLSTPLGGVGTSPTLSWTAPATGTPSYYQVGIYSWAYVAPPGNEQRTLLAIVRTTGTSIRVPPAILQTGAVYSFHVAAVYSPGLDITTRPLGSSSSPQSAYADTWSGLVTP